MEHTEAIDIPLSAPFDDSKRFFTFEFFVSKALCFSQLTIDKS
jgi:hypothetical protein